MTCPRYPNAPDGPSRTSSSEPCPCQPVPPTTSVEQLPILTAPLQLTDTVLALIQPLSAQPAASRGANGQPVLMQVPVADLKTGQQGPAGLSAYQVAVMNGFNGSQADWLASLNGPPGPVGPQGAPAPEMDISDLVSKTKTFVRVPLRTVYVYTASNLYPHQSTCNFSMQDGTSSYTLSCEPKYVPVTDTNALQMWKPEYSKGDWVWQLAGFTAEKGGLQLYSTIDDGQGNPKKIVHTVPVSTVADKDGHEDDTTPGIDRIVLNTAPPSPRLQAMSMEDGGNPTFTSFLLNGTPHGFAGFPPHFALSNIKAKDWKPTADEISLVGGKGVVSGLYLNDEASTVIIQYAALGKNGEAPTAFEDTLVLGSRYNTDLNALSKQTDTQLDTLKALVNDGISRAESIENKCLAALQTSTQNLIEGVFDQTFSITAKHGDTITFPQPFYQNPPVEITGSLTGDDGTVTQVLYGPAAKASPTQMQVSMLKTDSTGTSFQMTATTVTVTVKGRKSPLDVASASNQNASTQKAEGQ